MKEYLSLIEHPPSAEKIITNKYIVLWMIVTVTKADWILAPSALWMPEEKREELKLVAPKK